MTEAELLLAAEALSGVGAWVLDPGGLQLLWTPQACRLHGGQPGAPQPLFADLLARVAAEERAQLAAAVHAAAERGEAARVDYRVALAEGRARRLRCTLAATPDPPRRVLAAVAEIETPADDAAAATLARLQRALQAGGVGTWERDPGAADTRWDETARALLGLQPAPADEQLLRRVHPDDRARVAAALAGPGDRFETEFRVGLPEGGQRWLALRGGRCAGTEPAARAGVCVDVGARRARAPADHGRGLDDRAGVAPDELMSRLSHELRTPLNAVLGFAQVMEFDASDPLSARQRQRVGQIQAAGWQLLARVDDVLDLVRAESRRLPLAMGRLPLAGLIDECLAANAAAAAARGVTQQGLPDAEAAAAAWADRARLRQVLLRLLSNAVRYNREGGRVQVSARPEPDGGLTIEVSDTGPGMTGEQLAGLFEPYDRPGREPWPVRDTGIGLTLSRLAMQQMGGRLEVESRPGVGSTFRLCLPPGP